jgi:hypothetical protein
MSRPVRRSSLRSPRPAAPNSTATVFGEWQPKSFIGRPYFDRPGNANNPNGANQKPDYNRWQYGGDLGGPIIKDKLHFFARSRGPTRSCLRTAVNFRRRDNAPPRSSRSITAPMPQSFKQRLYFGKLTFFATDGHDQRQRVRPQREQSRRLSAATRFPSTAASEQRHRRLSGRLEPSRRELAQRIPARLQHRRQRHAARSEGPEIVLAATTVGAIARSAITASSRTTIRRPGRSRTTSPSMAAITSSRPAPSSRSTNMSGSRIR